MSNSTSLTKARSAHRSLRVAAAVVVAAAIPVAAGGGDPARGADAATSSEFTLRLKENAMKIVDTPPKGGRPSLGDYVAFNKRLLDENGKRVGSVHAHGIITAGGKDPAETLSGIVILEGGRLAVQQSFRFSDSVHRLAITGGTGKYEGATGSITAGMEGQGEDDLLFRVVLP